MKELKDQVLDAFKAYERMMKKMRKIAEITDGEIDFGWSLTRNEVFMYKGIKKVAEMFDLELTEEPSGIEKFPVEIRTKLGNLKVYEVE